jgi:hypothetical protein
MIFKRIQYIIKILATLYFFGLFLLIAFQLVSCREEISIEPIETSGILDTLEIPSPPSKFKLKTYVEHPDKTDSLCMDDIKLAENDIAKGHIFFCHPYGFGSIDLPQEKYLETLCIHHNMRFKKELISDVIFNAQTQGCYGAVMDNYIALNYDKDFKERLFHQADSILLAHNDTVDYSSCEKRPQILGENDYETTFSIHLTPQLSKEVKMGKGNDMPFMDIGFYIDKFGLSSGFFLNFFMDADHQSNQKVKEELFNMAIAEIKKVKKWEPGVYAGEKVNTEFNVRVFFYK